MSLLVLSKIVETTNNNNNNNKQSETKQYFSCIFKLEKNC